MAQLPPKIPNMSPSWPDFSTQQKNIMPTSISTNNIVTTNNYQNQNPSWVDEFLDFSSARRGAHRRSVSDSVTFLETPMLDGKHDGNNNDNEFDKFDDEQFLSMFSDEISGVNNMPPTLSSSNPSSPSDQNFVNNDNEKEKKENDLGEMKKEEDEKQLKYEPDEVESQCKQENSQPQSNNNNVTSSNDRITDPKRVKRILANRQSAQRSRVRKLQYISELERSVTSLQTEVSVLSPRVAFLDHQRLLLNVDNSALKQRIAALAQDKLFKDAHQEALKREIERLRQVYHHQNLKKMENANGSPLPSPSQKPICDSQTENEQLLNGNTCASVASKERVEETVVSALT
ncbi:putative transcription factor bZIP family [Medicago truncatula]|uniref:BZIP family transcription factor n=2 Tax=Medicago truncatula TaxID=3880 RepID=G7ZUL8_MEDTR|nr:basic leucine zipper 34 [Medicago truncatula]KEH39223.1 bZIP family transcription factor [Medicago truncatula]RHN75796.1 putative transcription factor bZIP family [Medicago truncatula]